jgi:hypothetical protein
MVFVEVYKNTYGDIYVCYRNAITRQVLVNGVITQSETTPETNHCLVLKHMVKDGSLLMLTGLPNDEFRTLATISEREPLYERVLIAARRSKLTLFEHPLSSFVELYEMDTLHFYPFPDNLDSVNKPYNPADHFFVNK